VQTLVAANLERRAVPLTTVSVRDIFGSPHELAMPSYDLFGGLICKVEAFVPEHLRRWTNFGLLTTMSLSFAAPPPTVAAPRSSLSSPRLASSFSSSDAAKAAGGGVGGVGGGGGGCHVWDAEPLLDNDTTLIGTVLPALPLCPMACFPCF
jgi:hypothetical protein